MIISEGSFQGTSATIIMLAVARIARVAELWLSSNELGPYGIELSVFHVETGVGSCTVDGLSTRRPTNVVCLST